MLGVKLEMVNACIHLHFVKFKCTFCSQKLHIICVYNTIPVKVYTCLLFKYIGTCTGTSNMFILWKCYFITVCCIFGRVTRLLQVLLTFPWILWHSFIVFIFLLLIFYMKVVWLLPVNDMLLCCRFVIEFHISKCHEY